jgi:outer membrane protein TolC
MLTTLALLLASTASAVSLDQAVDNARDSSPVASLSQARVAQAQAQVRQATATMLPQISAGAGSIWQNEVEMSLMPICYQFYLLLQESGQPVQPSMCDGIESPVVMPGQQWQWQVQGTQAVVAPQAILYRKAALMGQDIAQHQGESELYQLEGYVVEAWHASARHQALLSDAREALELAEHIAALARTLVDNGVATRDQVLQAEGAVATAKATVARSQAASQAADKALELITGQPGAADPFVVPTAVPSLEQATASLQRPDLGVADAQIEAAQAVVRAERGAAMPILGVTGKLMGLDPAPMIYDEFNWSVMVGLTVPIVQGGAVMAKVDSAQAQVEMAHAARRLIREQAELELIRIHGELSAAMASLDEREEALRLAEEAVEAAEARLKEGAGSMLDLQQTHAGVAEARVHLTLAKADAAYAYDKLRHAQGNL